MADATPAAECGCSDLTVFCRLDELGLVVTGQRCDADRAVRVAEPERWCRRWGCEGARATPSCGAWRTNRSGGALTTLLVTVRRYRCPGCGHVWRQETSKAARPGAQLSRRGLRWALEGLVVAHLTVARIAEGKRVLIQDTRRFDGVRVIGVDEHVGGTPAAGTSTSP